MAFLNIGATTTAEGKFSIRQVQSGTYQVKVDSMDFVAMPNNGWRSQVEVTPGETTRDFKLKMLPQGVIAGRVLDGNSDPVEHVRVEAIRGTMTRSYQWTDANGDFRLPALSPGKYLVGAIPASRTGPPEGHTDDAREEYFGPTFYPSAPGEEGASPVEVRAGAEASGIEIHLARSLVVGVSGIVTGIPVNVTETQLHVYGSHQQSEVRVEGGKFTIWRLPRGKYRLVALSHGRDGQFWVSAPEQILVADSDINDLELALALPMEVSGRIAWDGDPPGGERRPGKLNMNSVGSKGGSSNAAIQADGSFRFKEIEADQYEMDIGGMPGTVYIKSLLLGSAEMPNRRLDLRHWPGGEPLTVTLSNAAARISGVARDSKAAVPNLPVALFSGGPDGFVFSRTEYTFTDGSYSFTGLAPGTYKILVVNDEDFKDLRENGIGSYEQLAEKVQVSEGDKLFHDLKIPE